MAGLKRQKQSARPMNAFKHGPLPNNFVIADEPKQKFTVTQNVRWLPITVSTNSGATAFANRITHTSLQSDRT